MRFIASLLLCAGVLLTATGCDPSSNKHYFTQGVGSNLYSEDVAAQSELQDIYVAHICHQAGLDPSNCGVDSFSHTTWGLFVQAGMNDIDQRCDAYLIWLDNVRRSEAPTLKEIGDIHTATELIMQAGGVGAGPIAIVAAAFGLATNTFTNLTSRLILEVNRSTVQAVVLGRQQKYRQELLGNRRKNIPGIMIASKPAAIFALRSYLRLCMPMTIETEINNTVATFEGGGGAALDRREPMISAKTVGVGTYVISRPAVDASYKNLRSQLFPGGSATPDSAIVVYVREILGQPPIGIGLILNDPRYASLRTKISACIVARGVSQPCAPGSLSQFR